MVVMSFCTQCSEKKVKEVKLQLEKLFSSKVPHPWSCWICNTPLPGQTVTPQNQPLPVESRDEAGGFDNHSDTDNSDWMTVCLKTYKHTVIKTEPEDTFVKTETYDSDDTGDDTGDGTSSEDNISSGEDVNSCGTEDDGNKDSVATGSKDLENMRGCFRVGKRNVFLLSEEEQAQDTVIQISGLRPELREFLLEVDVQAGFKGFHCKLCAQLIFRTLKQFCSHVMSTHQQGKGLGTQQFQCTECCDQLFNTFSQWKAHTKPYKCPVPDCQYRNEKRNKLVDHNEAAHLNERTHKCNGCLQTFKTRRTLRTHIRNVHERGKCFTCSDCGAQFFQMHHLKQHGRTHTKEKPFHCDQCDKSFSINSLLKLHKMDHTGEKPFVCDQCGFQTKTSLRLRNHMATHIAPEQKQSFQCDQCGLTFKMRGSLYRHTRKHVEERQSQCRFCDKRFVLNLTRDVHEKKHPEWDGVRKYVCKICGLDTHTKFNLKGHMERHNGVKPFKCSYCDFRAHRKTGVQAHIKKHHGQQQGAEVVDQRSDQWREAVVEQPFEQQRAVVVEQPFEQQRAVVVEQPFEQQRAVVVEQPFEQQRAVIVEQQRAAAVVEEQSEQQEAVAAMILLDDSQVHEYVTIEEV